MEHIIEILTLNVMHLLQLVEGNQLLTFVYVKPKRNDKLLVKLGDKNKTMLMKKVHVPDNVEHTKDEKY